MSFKILKKLKYTALGILLLPGFSALAQRKHIIFESAFENTSSITNWYERSILKPWSAVIDTDRARTGKSSLLVKLIRGVDVLNGPRAELGMKPTTNDEYWYGFSHFMPTQYASDPATEIVNQWQALPDLSLGEEWRSPPLALEIKADRYKIAIRWSAAKITTAQNTGIDYIDIGPVEHNQWVDWVFHIKWGYNGGTLQVWNKGKLVLERLNKPIGYNDDVQPYFKTGIYKWEWSTANTVSTSKERSYYIDDIRVGDKLATYDDVAPGETAGLPIVNNTLKVAANTDGSYTVSFTASKTVSLPTRFILYVAANKGTYAPTYSNSLVTLVKDSNYKIIFK